MKRALSAVFAMILTLGVAGCGGQSEAPAPEPEPVEVETAPQAEAVEITIEEPQEAPELDEETMSQVADALAQAEEAMAQEEDIEPRYTEEMDQVSYAFGAQMGQMLTATGQDININVLSSALNAAIAGEELALTDEQMGRAMEAYQMKRQEEMMRERAGQELSEEEQQAEADEAAAQAAEDEAAGDDPLASENNRFSYAVGAQVARSLELPNGDAIPIQPQILIEGLTDVLEERDMGLSNTMMQEVMMAYQQKMQAEQMEEMQKEALANAAIAEEYMAENAKLDGVQIIEEGILHYEVIEEGEGPSPKETDQVSVHYQGTFTDGEEFDSSYTRGQPAQFGLNQVIRGWTEGLQRMKVGAKYKFYIHPDWAYGEMGRPGSIPPNAVLVFTVELLDILDS